MNNRQLIAEQEALAVPDAEVFFVTEGGDDLPIAGARLGVNPSNGHPAVFLTAVPCAHVEPV